MEKPVTISKILQESGLSHIEHLLSDKLRVYNVDHLKYVNDSDLTELGLSQPEIRRLWKHYNKLCPQSLVGKLKKAVFNRSASIDKQSTPDNRHSPSPTPSTSGHIIPAASVTLCKQLGKGEFGAVWQAVWVAQNEHGLGEKRVQVAVKCVLPDKMQSSIGDFIREAAIMHQMQHKHIVQMYGVVLETKTVMLVSELAALHSLLECVRDTKLRATFNISRLCTYAEQIADGMAYLEDHKMIHRDLAARNILVFDADKVKISDFGLSRSLGTGEDYYRSEFNPTMKLPIAWCAPECIKMLKFTTASDVWAYGVTLWEMFTYGLQPWHGMKGDQILSTIDEPACLRLDEPDACPTAFYSLMIDCWTHDSSSRPSFATVLNRVKDIRPEKLLTICACYDGQKDHLQFAQGEILTVVDKTPPTYPDGFYWIGVTESGRSGLFLPSNTVAHIGVDYPKLPANFGLLRSNNSASATNSPKNQRKLDKKSLISAPTNAQHIEHIGWEDTHSEMNSPNPSLRSNTITPQPTPRLGKKSPPLPTPSEVPDPKPARSTPIMGMRRFMSNKEAPPKPARPVISGPILGTVMRSNENLSIVDRPTNLIPETRPDRSSTVRADNLPPPGDRAPSPTREVKPLSPILKTSPSSTSTTSTDRGRHISRSKSPSLLERAMSPVRALSPVGEMLTNLLSPTTPAPTPSSSLFDEVFSELNKEKVELTGFGRTKHTMTNLPVIHVDHLRGRAFSLEPGSAAAAPITNHRKSSFDDGMDEEDDRPLIQSPVVRREIKPTVDHVKHVSMADAKLINDLATETKRRSEAYFTKYSAERQHRHRQQPDDSTSSSTTSLNSNGMGANASCMPFNKNAKHAAIRERMKNLGQISRHGNGISEMEKNKKTSDTSEPWTPEAEDAYKLLIECGKNINAEATKSHEHKSCKPSPSTSTGSSAPSTAPTSTSTAPPIRPPVTRRSSARFKLAGVDVSDSTDGSPMRLVSLNKVRATPPPVPRKPPAVPPKPQSTLHQSAVPKSQSTLHNNAGQGAPVNSLEVDKYQLLDFVMQGLNDVKVES